MQQELIDCFLLYTDFLYESVLVRPVAKEHIDFLNILRAVRITARAAVGILFCATVSAFCDRSEKNKDSLKDQFQQVAK